MHTVTYTCTCTCTCTYTYTSTYTYTYTYIHISIHIQGTGTSRRIHKTAGRAYQGDTQGAYDRLDITVSFKYSPA